MGILEVTDSSTNSGPYPTVVNVAVVLEEEVVMDNLGDFTNALMMLVLALVEYLCNILLEPNRQVHMYLNKYIKSSLSKHSV